MSKSAEEILFHYLRDILFSPEKAVLELADLPEIFQDLGQGMLFLSNCLQENKTFLCALARGEIYAELPSADNPIAAPAKDLQAAMRHISWQTTQISMGDYGQRLNFLGEFSDSFNLMVEQLAARTQKLELERALAEEGRDDLAQIQDLFLILMESVPEHIVLLDMKTNVTLFNNRAAEVSKSQKPLTIEILRQKLFQHSRTYNGKSSRWDLSFPVPKSEQKDQISFAYYSVHSFPIYWKGRNSMLYIIDDQTSETENEQRLMRDAVTDPLTELHNRRFAMQLLQEWHSQKRSFCVSMIDIDHLKYCNDEFGHMVGDRYLLTVGNYLSQLEGSIISRIGGDEFLAASLDFTLEQQNLQLEKLRSQLLRNENNELLPFTQSFSFGSCSHTSEDSLTVSEILAAADLEMYRYKLAFKPQLHPAEIITTDK